MKKKIFEVFAVCTLGVILIAGCGKTLEEPQGAIKTESQQETEKDIVSEEQNKSAESEEYSQESTSEESEAENEKDESVLEDGVYSASFETDSSMFHVNEAYDNLGTLTVQDGQMTIHVTLAGKGILQLYLGLAEDAEKEGAEVLEPTLDQVTYSDGLTDEAYGFDIPVPYLDQEFDLALIGKKEKWYDHKVKVSVIEKKVESEGDLVYTGSLEDGEYSAEVVLSGGSGKATVESPATLIVQDGKYYATIIWSSKYYDYMLVDGVKYENEAAEGENSKFTIPVAVLSEPITVIGDTIAMSTPHEIEYTLTFTVQ